MVKGVRTSGDTATGRMEATADGRAAGEVVTP